MAHKHKIKFFDLSRQYHNLKEELLHEINKVYNTGTHVYGTYTKAFENEIAALTDRKYAVVVNSCTQALSFAVNALGIHGKIAIPTQSFVATVNSLIAMDCEPVFCDVDYESGILSIDKFNHNFDAEEIKALMYVNLYGNCVDYDKLLTLDHFFNTPIPIIEDAAQSFGSSYKGIPSGKLGTVSCLSFAPTKPLNNYGTGGMVLTDDEAVYRNLLDIRDNGKSRGYMFAGTNSTMSESDCAQMLVKLKHFPDWQKRRQDIAEYYNVNLHGYVVIPHTDPDVVNSWHKYVIKTEDREQIWSRLTKKGVETLVHYNTPLHMLDVSLPYVDLAQPMPNAERFSKTCLSLPIYPEMTDTEVEYVVQSVIEACENR